jgi:PAS domain S-box-containing protein
VAPDLTATAVGQFRLIARIGRGQSATVYRALTGAGVEQVAFKVVDPEVTDSPGFLDRFQASVGRLAGLRDTPHLLRVHDCGVHEGMAFVVTDLAAGGSLKDLLRAGPLGVESAMLVAKAVAEGLARAHQLGLVHRDVKPGNVLFDTSARPLLADFGLARTHFGFAVGTPGYIAPEQAEGAEPDSRADVYGLAVVVFEMLAGVRLRGDASGAELLRQTMTEPPPSITDRRPDLPRRLNAVLARALAFDPEDRYPTTLEMLAELEDVLGRAPVTAEEEPEAVAPGARPAAVQGASFEEQREHTLALVDRALCAAIAIDESGYVVSWNSTAEEMFGWKREEIVGRVLSSTLVPARYREAHERGLRRSLEEGEGRATETVMEVWALDRDGREFPIELSLAPALRWGPRALMIGFARSAGAGKQSARLKTAETAVFQALNSDLSLDRAASQVLQAIAGGLDCSVGALWQIEARDTLHCVEVWSAPGTNCREFLEVTRQMRFRNGQGLPGRAWATGNAVLLGDLLHESEEPRALAAMRGGLRSALALAVQADRAAEAVLEFYAPDLRREDEELLLRLAELGRRIGRVARG